MKVNFTQRVVITIALVIFARLGIFAPVPGIDHDTFYQSIKTNQLVSFLNIFSGGGFSTVGIFALGIVPYINSSIAMQILVKINPSLEKLQQEEGENGRQKINQLTRLFALVWACLQSFSVALWIRPYVFNWNLNFIFDITLALTIGSLIVMWISETITEYGLGNGTSLLIFFNVIANFPKKSMGDIILNFRFDPILLLKFVATALLFLFMLVLAIVMQEAVKKIEIVSVRQLTDIDLGFKNTEMDNYIPLKLYQGGVMPIIFASAVVSIPIYLVQLTDNSGVIQKALIAFLSQEVTYSLFYCLLIIGFSYLYASFIFNPVDVEKNLKKTGSSISGVRPGADTVNYLTRVLNRLTFLGSLLLCVIALIPSIALFFNLTFMKSISPTSILILVGVAIQTTKQAQSYKISKQYEELSK
uniref:preprotein translocase subunit SecY n=1 Tax=Timspurckia oligopyrenoides TaxID=708627 RepID=UPI001FCD59BC|nr:preprotein translocase subunit SecY [Timspurckia oligopyrenoides]UNJ17439.1 preprotein translocase subunit SecY [Timspurckia oligopyrenoides]